MALEEAGIYAGKGRAAGWKREWGVLLVRCGDGRLYGKFCRNLHPERGGRAERGDSSRGSTRTDAGEGRDAGREGIFSEGCAAGRL